MTAQVDGDGFLILDGPERRKRPECRALVLTLRAEETAALQRASEHDLDVLEARIREDLAITLGLLDRRAPLTAWEAGVAERLNRRSTREVLEDHLRLRAAGELEADLRRNISPEIAVLTRTGTWRGHDGVRAQAEALARYTGHDGYRYDAVVVEGEMGYMEWRANGHGEMKIERGADAYIVRDGKIVAQSIFYDVEDGDGDVLDTDA